MPYLVTPYIDFVAKKEYLERKEEVIEQSSELNHCLNLADKMKEAVEEVLFAADLEASLVEKLQEYVAWGTELTVLIRQWEHITGIKETLVDSHKLFPEKFKNKFDKYTGVYAQSFDVVDKINRLPVSLVNNNKNVNSDRMTLITNQALWLMISDCVVNAYRLNLHKKVEQLTELYISIARKQSTIVNDLLREWDIISNPKLSKKIDDYLKKPRPKKNKKRNSDDVFAELGI